MPDDQGFATEQEIEDNKDWEQLEDDTTEYWFMSGEDRIDNEDGDKL